MHIVLNGPKTVWFWKRVKPEKPESKIYLLGNEKPLDWEHKCFEGKTGH
jgi:hypothetical protein